jgi:HTH domain.
LLTADQERVLAALQRHSDLTSGKLAGKLGVSRAGARQMLLSLVELGHAQARVTAAGRVVYRRSPEE